jgi:WD40 repeat protein
MNRQWMIGLVLSLLFVSCQVAPQPTTPSPTPMLQETPTPTGPVCFPTTGEIIPFAFTPDSQSILNRQTVGVQIFDLQSLKESEFIQSPKPIISAALSPDGETLVWSLDDNTIQLVSMSDHKVLHTLSGHSDMVTKLRFTPDGKELVSASHDQSIRVWDMQGNELRSFLPPGQVVGIGISPDGKMLATVPFDGPVTLWDLETFEKIKEIGGTGGFDTSDAEFSADGQYLAADLASGLYLWRISDGQSLWEQPINSLAVAFSPSGQTMAYGEIGETSTVVIGTPEGILHTLTGHHGPVWALFFSADGKLLLSTDGVDMRIWEVESGSLRYIGKSVCP